MNRYDTIVIGAGHNGLVCAAYLAHQGKQVLVLEAGEHPGGLASAREFHPGFNASVAHTAGHFAPEIARDLGLAAHGYAQPSAPLPMRDLLDENFESELLKATLSWDGLVGSRLAPRSPTGRFRLALPNVR